jgi:hypothetical protein
MMGSFWARQKKTLVQDDILKLIHKGKKKETFVEEQTE